MINDNYSAIQRGPAGTYYIVPRKGHDHRCVYAGKCISELDDAQEAAKLLQDLNARWRGASPSQRNRLLLTILEAIYVYVERREIVGLRPRQAFLTLFDTVEDNDAVTLSSNPTGNFGRVGGDGGESNSPSRNSPDQMCYKLVRRFDLAVAGSRRRDSVTANRLICGSHHRCRESSIPKK